MSFGERLGALQCRYTLPTAYLGLSTWTLTQSQMRLQEKAPRAVKGPVSLLQSVDTSDRRQGFLVPLYFRDLDE